ncbi:hypothetical protein MKX03_003722, partial [Papaver bracteatum]
MMQCGVVVVPRVAIRDEICYGVVQCCNGCWSDRRENALMLSTEIVELHIGLKNYDPQKDKRLSGSMKIGLVYME